MAVAHPFEPVMDGACHTLILGSFPSVKSRAEGFYYGHPQNRFWRMLAAIYEDVVPEQIQDKRAFLVRHHIALWDVIASCDITGSSDASVRNAVPVDIARVLEMADIRQVICNGSLSGKLYAKYLKPLTGLEAVVLPSTSPANAAWSLERLTEAWRTVLLDDGKLRQ